ncbi:MAG TPA: hypothetical protein VGQ95_10770 [Chthoniobacterales bacterium]|nr:hypothetical protein [Chthoniobacterales bacterium]
MSKPVGLPALFASSWPQFVDEWCLGTPPSTAPDECARALNALLMYWPERANELAAGPIRGLSVVANAIDAGLILADAAHLPGVEPVMSRLRSGERGSLSELTVGSALVRLGFYPSFGVAAGTKVPDLALTIDPITIFVEVIAPDRAEIVKHFTDRIDEIASSILAVSSDANVELFLDCDLDELDMPTLTTAIGGAAFSDDVQSISSVGRFLKRRYSFPPVVSPSVPSETSGTVLGVARAVVNGDQATGALAAVRAGVFDGRAKRMLAAELHHFAKSNPNLLVIDTGSVAGGLHDWAPSITRCFQPTQNTRITAVVLYFTGVMGNPPHTHRAWKVLINPHAANPLPAQLLEALTKLPTALTAA